MAPRALALLASVCLAACSSAPPPAAPAPRSSPAAVTAAPVAGPVVISLVGTNDVHGRIDSLPVLGGYLANLRAVRGDDGVVVVDAGDMFQGTLESNLAEGVPMVLGYDALRYDAVTLGNHEFDYGPVGPSSTPRGKGDDPRGALKARAKEATFPFLTANIVDGVTDRPLDYPNFHPTVLLTKKDGVKVGLIGISTEDTPKTTIAVNFAGLKVLPPAPVVEARARELRAQGANLVVVLAHAGGKCLTYGDDDRSCDENQEIMRLANALPEGTVDAIVAGHTHDGMANRVHGTPIIESFSYGKDFGRIDFTFDGASHALKKTDILPPTPLKTGVAYLGKPVIPDEALAAKLKHFTDDSRALKESLLGVELTTPITREHGHESPLGNLFADMLLRSRPNAQVGMMNGGGLRSDLPAGPLHYGALFEAMPFDNRLAVVHLTGADLRRIVVDNLESSHSIASWAGIRVLAECTGNTLTVKLQKTTGKGGVGAGGGFISDADRVTLVTSDFIALGGDNVVVPPNSVTFEDELLRDAFETQLRAMAGHPLSSGALYDPGHRRVIYPGERPVSCKR
jgi:2',3'-cyclic-nucleotide 2'-phosphodiesterase (5'-nucleotidase family)